MSRVKLFLTLHTLKIRVFSLSLLFQVFCKQLCMYIKYPAEYLPVQSNNRNTRKWCKICSKLAVETPERRSGIFVIINIFCTFLVLLLLTLYR